MAAERKMVKHPTIGAATFATVPLRFLTYRGDATQMAREHQLVGPNTLGELWVAVSAEKGTMAGEAAPAPCTRVGFAPLQRVKEAG